MDPAGGRDGARGGVEELVADKKYPAGPVLEETKAAAVRTFIPERQQKGQRHGAGKEGRQQAVYENRRRGCGSPARWGRR
jgi:hypothetical protein